MKPRGCRDRRSSLCAAARNRRRSLSPRPATAREARFDLADLRHHIAGDEPQARTARELDALSIFSPRSFCQTLRARRSSPSSPPPPDLLNSLRQALCITSGWISARALPRARARPSAPASPSLTFHIPCCGPSLQAPLLFPRSTGPTPGISFSAFMPPRLYVSETSSSIAPTALRRLLKRARLELHLLHRQIFADLAEDLRDGLVCCFWF